MHYVDLVATLAVIQFMYFMVLTGQARRISGLKAPAVTGDEGFERMYRVQMNTLELLIAFLPSLFLAAKYWSPPIVAGVGAVFIVGRFLYWRGYISDPSKRALGFLFSFFPTVILAITSIVGIILAIVKNV